MAKKKDNVPTEEQKRQYIAMSEQQRKLVDEGYATVVLRLDDQSVICDFNMPPNKKLPIPEKLAEGLAESLYPEMLEFFSNPENRAKVDEWLREKKENGKK